MKVQKREVKFTATHFIEKISEYVFKEEQDKYTFKDVVIIDDNIKIGFILEIVDKTFEFIDVMLDCRDLEKIFNLKVIKNISITYQTNENIQQINMPRTFSLKLY